MSLAFRSDEIQAEALLFVLTRYPFVLRHYPFVFCVFLPQCGIIGAPGRDEKYEETPESSGIAAAVESHFSP